MPASDQKINPDRYQIIPRVLIFPMRAGSVLLIKLLPRNGKATSWTGRYNGPGGHVEAGEDILTAGKRELFEETGLAADVSLCGAVIVDTGRNPGIGLYILRADHVEGEILNSPEGLPEWIALDKIHEYSLVEDVALFLEKILEMKPGDPPFAAVSFYDENDRLKVKFG